MSLFLFIFALFYLLCSWHHAEEETGKEMAEELDKHERDLENQKGNLTESLTNLRLSSCCRLVKQLVRQYFGNWMYIAKDITKHPITQ